MSLGKIRAFLEKGFDQKFQNKLKLKKFDHAEQIFF